MLAPMHPTESTTRYAASKARQATIEGLRASARTRELLEASLLRIARTAEGMRTTSARLERDLAHVERARAMLRRITAGHPTVASRADSDPASTQARV
jgi:hypothetical protein